MAYKMPKDFTGHPIPVLSFKDGGAHQIALTASSARNSTAFEVDARNEKGEIILSLYSTVDCFLALGDNTVTADTSDHFFPAGIYYNIYLDNSQTHLAAIRASSDGTLYISEME